MRRSSLVQWLRKRSALVTLLSVAPMVVVILGLTACVEFPVGDPEKSKVDPRYTSIWLNEEGDSGTLLFIRPYDSRTYFVSWFGYQNENRGIKPEIRIEAKAWLTKIGGAVFITLERLSCAEQAGLEKESEDFYIVMKTDLEDKSLLLQIVDGTEEPAKSAKSRKELEAVIKKYVESDDLYAGPASVFKKTEDKALIRSVLQAFHPEGLSD